MSRVGVAATWVALSVVAASVGAQVQPPPAPWRGAGPTPCVGSDRGVYKCPAATGIVAIRAGRLFDAKAGRLVQDQVIVIEGERIAAVGAASQVRIPAGAKVIDLSSATVLPGLIDAHTHMFNVPRPGMSRDSSTLIAVQNLQADLRAGFTAARDMSSHGNGYADVDIRNAINEGRIEGPRFQVSGRGIVWAMGPNPLGNIAVVVGRGSARGRPRSREHGVDWIKLFPTGGYSFTAAGKAEYELRYPMPVLQALIDEAHRLGHKTACHVYGGEGQHNAIVAGCDTIEHAFGLRRKTPS